MAIMNRELNNGSLKTVIHKDPAIKSFFPSSLKSTTASIKSRFSTKGSILGTSKAKSERKFSPVRTNDLFLSPKRVIADTTQVNNKNGVEGSISTVQPHPDERNQPLVNSQPTELIGQTKPPTAEPATTAAEPATTTGEPGELTTTTTSTTAEPELESEKEVPTVETEFPEIVTQAPVPKETTTPPATIREPPETKSPESEATSHTTVRPVVIDFVSPKSFSSTTTRKPRPDTKREPFSHPLTFSSRSTTSESLNEYERMEMMEHEQELQRAWRSLDVRLLKVLPTPLRTPDYLKDPPELGFEWTRTSELRKEYNAKKIQSFVQKAFVRNEALLKYVEPKTNRCQILRHKHIRKETIMTAYFDQHYDRFKKPPFKPVNALKKC